MHIVASTLQPRVAYQHLISLITPRPIAGNIVIGRIEVIHIDDAVLGADGFADPARLDTIGRLGGQLYCGTRERFELQRPG
jgi:hypothetical protein